MQISIALALVLLVTAVFSLSVPNKRQASDNPFSGADMYVNPEFQAEVDQAINQFPAQKSLLMKARNYSTAFWIDQMAKISKIKGYLDGAKAQHSKTGRSTVTMFVIYDLPNRDCAALASNGELHCQDAACAQGLHIYQTQYIDPIVNIFKQYPSLTIVAIIEPDSLPNLATNLNMPKCAQAQTAYKTGVAYAIKKLATVSNVHMYVDAAHGGWLGWEDNLNKIAPIFQEVVGNAGGPSTIRGFITNTANYQPLGSMTDTADPCKLEQQYNFAINEVKYVNLLSQKLNGVGFSSAGYLIDTSRDGVTNERSDCSNWCNIKGAGLGARPTTSTSSSGLNIIDAYVWIKTPGESDGTSNSSSPRYDAHCSSADSQTPAPEAGTFWPQYFLDLCQLAKPPL